MASLTCRAAALCPLLAIACGGSPSGGGEPIRIDGSSTVHPLSEAVVEAYSKRNRKTPVSLAFSGTRTGFERFCAGLTDLQNASRPIALDEQKICESKDVAYVELPVAYDGITIIVNPRNDWASDITVAELRTLWQPEAQGKVTRWNQVRDGWPDREIHLSGPGHESGTFDFFTEAIVGRLDASRTDYSSNADDEQTVRSVAQDELALGYVPFGYFDHNRARLRALPLDDLKDDIGRGPIEPTASNISRGTYRPLLRPLFIYVNAERLRRHEVDAFLKYYLGQVGGLAAGAGTVPLTGRAYELSLQRLAKRTTGTMYKGHDAANLTVEYLLNQYETARPPTPASFGGPSRRR